MKTSWLLQALCAASLSPALALAQPAHAPALPHRADLHASVGWASVSSDEFVPGDDWDNSTAQGIVGVGWYWTDHLKTEADLRFASSAQFFHYEQVQVGGRTVYRSSRIRVGASTISLGQHYQFFRNAWVHPYVGGGVDLRRESREEDVDPVMAYDEGRRQFTEIEPRRLVGPSVSWVVRPFALAGVKAYVSPRAFFRADVRAGFGSDVEHVVMSAGFGWDF